MADHFQLRLVDSRMLAPTVRHLAFERVDGQPLAFVPGQFLQIHFHYDDGTPTKRSYSVATVGDGSSPGVPVEIGRIEIAVSYVEGGAATKLLGELPIGGTVDASGPYGRFCLQAGDVHPRYLLLATGTGVTPYRAMLPQIEKLLAQGGREVVLLEQGEELARGVAAGVDERGQLLLDTASGRQTIATGDVSLRLADGAA